jgi:hypothetical protein
VITAFFGLGCGAALALAWPRPSERFFAGLLGASWLSTLLVLLLPAEEWSYGNLVGDALVVTASAVALAVKPRAWLALVCVAGLLQLAAHVALQVTEVSGLDRWRYLLALDCLFALQLAAVAAPGAARRLRGRHHAPPLGDLLA